MHENPHYLSNGLMAPLHESIRLRILVVHVRVLNEKHQTLVKIYTTVQVATNILIMQNIHMQSTCKKADK